MTKCTALDLAPFNIRVSNVSPGYILTEHQLGKIKTLKITREQAKIERGGSPHIEKDGKTGGGRSSGRFSPFG
jgi:NAD(P)-dependent dehydrogenase (short-subunit alcohol dehydrogenase family)